MPYKNKGFTIIEMLVVAPIVILFIGAFIAVIVSMTGEVLTTRSQSAQVFDIQGALDRIEQDVKSSGGLLAEPNITIANLQGYNNDSISGFSNVGTNGNMLILNAYATTANPLSDTSRVVYNKNQPNLCSSDKVSLNTPLTYNIIYFVKDNTLWRRVLMPAFYDTVGCSVPWQRPSCASVSQPFCDAADTRLVDGVDDTSGFIVSYYSDSSPTTPNSDAVNSSKSAAVRQAALSSTPEISVSISSNTTVAGRTIESSGATRSRTINNDISATDNIQGPAITSQPSDVTVNSGANASFTASASGTSLTIQWQQSTNNGATWSNISGATSSTLSRTAVTNTMDGYRYRAVFSNSMNQVISSEARLGVNLNSWTNLSLNSGWSTYSSSYAVGAYRKTTAGIVLLKGLVKKSTAVASGEAIAVLPVSYRPAHRLLFETSTNANVYSRIDINTDGSIIVVKGDDGWVALDGINFVPDNGRYTMTNIGTFYNSWSNYTFLYGGGYAPASYVSDDMGRTYVSGLVSGGVTTNGTVIFQLPPALLPTRYMHIPASNSAYGFLGVEASAASSGIVAKGYSTTSGYISVQSLFYPTSYSGWINLTLSNSWVEYSSTFSSPQYTKAADGLVSLKGLIKSGSTSSGAVIATLPVGYRPAETLLIGLPSSGAYGRLDINASGQILFRAGSNAWFSLDGITFYADQ